MACPQCGDPYVSTDPGEGICDECKRQNALVERGQRATGHGPHDDPGPHGDYGERDDG